MREELLTVEQVTLLFFQNVLSYFDIPTSIIHDVDTRLTNHPWKYLWTLLELCAIAIPDRCPKADGQTEDINYTIG